jgi:RNA polymerase sigma factor (sigma-70 family)
MKQTEAAFLFIHAIKSQFPTLYNRNGYGNTHSRGGDAVLTEGGLVQTYADEFLEKVFYFCLKRCGNPTQAEDLSGDITLNVLNALAGGFVPQNLYAWIWAVARNRYSKWAAQNRMANANTLPGGVFDNEIAADGGVEERIIETEQLNMLRRKLAFVTREYREILIAYYIDGKKTGEIAESLDIPKGTVVSKLHRIRNKLKEGFEMVKEFGVLSYKPENVGFIMNGTNGRDGAPGCFIDRMLSKNILLAAYRNPMPAEELAIEMGIALPYMEDELSKLLNATLMKKNGAKYETAFFIVSAKAQQHCQDYLESITPELTSSLIESLEYRIKCYDVNGAKWHEGYQAYEDMKWALLMRRADDLFHNVVSHHKPEKPVNHIGHSGHTIRPDNGEWDLLGLESGVEGKPPFIGLHGGGETPDISNSGYNYSFNQFKFQYENIQWQTPVQLTEIQNRALVDCAKNNAHNSPADILDGLAETGHLIKKDGTYRPAFWVQFAKELAEQGVYFTDALGRLTPEQKAEFARLSAPACKLLDSYFAVCHDAVKKEVPSFLKDDEHQIHHAIVNLMSARDTVFSEALNSGWLTYDKADPESAKRRMLGTFLVIGE